MTQARDELADLINRAAYGHERIILTRHSKAVACIVPPEDLAKLEQLEQQGQERVNLTSAGPVLEMHPRAAAPDALPLAAQHRPPGS